MLCKSDRIAVPRPLRAEGLDEIHGSHMGESKSLSFARNYVFWPSMTAQIKEKSVPVPCVMMHSATDKRERHYILMTFHDHLGK